MNVYTINTNEWTTVTVNTDGGKILEGEQKIIINLNQITDILINTEIYKAPEKDNEEACTGHTTIIFNLINNKRIACLKVYDMESETSDKPNILQKNLDELQYSLIPIPNHC